MKITRAKLSITIENGKISQLKEEQELPEVWLKSENQIIILHKTDHKFVIYIFRIYIQNATSFVLSKKCLDVFEPDKRQMKTQHFCCKVLFCFAPQQSPPPPPTQWGEGGAITSPAVT